MSVFSPSLTKGMLAAAMAALSLASAPAHAFADDDARKAILDLRQQVRQLTEQNQRATLQLADQIESLQREVARLRGQVEQMSRPAPPNAGNDGGEQGATAGDPKEQAAYDGAIDLYRKGKYKEASDALAAFTALYPNSALAPTAQFYLGSSRYMVKDYKGSIEQLQALVKQSPDHARAPDALLVVAGSQVELNDRAGAKATLQRLIKAYPGTPAAEAASKRLQLLQ